MNLDRKTRLEIAQALLQLANTRNGLRMVALVDGTFLEIERAPLGIVYTHLKGSDLLGDQDREDVTDAVIAAMTDNLDWTSALANRGDS